MQWMGWAPPPTQKPGKFDFLAPMLENYFKGKEQFNQRQDFRNIQAPGFDLGGLQSNAYQRAMGQQALQNRMPMSPMDQARMGLIQAQTGAVGQPSPMHPLTQKNIESQIKDRETPTPQYSPPEILKDGNSYGQPEGTIKQTSPIGEIKLTPPSAQSPSKEVAKYMKELVPGSPEWMAMAKISGGGTTVNIGSEGPAPQGDRTAIDKLENVKRRAVRAKELWDSKYTGWEGWTGGIREKMSGMMSGDEAKFRMSMKSLVKQMYADSGKQLSDKEWDRLQFTMPRLEVADKIFPSQLDEWITGIDQDLAQMRGSLREAGYITPGDTGTSPVLGLTPEEAREEEELKRRLGIK